jgi:threonine dehydratase
MWERMRPLLDGNLVVTLEQTRQAMRLLAEKARVIAEGAGALSVAGALSDEFAGQARRGPIVAVISGGNVDLKVFCEIVGAS